jgi:predicted ATP-binding protein involved in virulence
MTRLSLRDFRCFEALDLDLDPTTVLVGANDTGKSAILDDGGHR